MSNGCDATPGVRAAVTALPEQLLSPPYELRTEMNWIDFSGTANPLGTPPSFIRAMQAALAAGELNYPPDREAHTPCAACWRASTACPWSRFWWAPPWATWCAPSRRPTSPAPWAWPCRARWSTRWRPATPGTAWWRSRAPPASSCPTPPRPRATASSFDAAVLANPGYPTSRLLPQPTLLAYLDACTWVVVDERVHRAHARRREHGGPRERAPQPRGGALALRAVRHAGHPHQLLRGAPRHHRADRALLRQLGRADVRRGAWASWRWPSASTCERTREFLDSEIPWLQCMLEPRARHRHLPRRGELRHVRVRRTAPTWHLGVASTDELAGRLQLRRVPHPQAAGHAGARPTATTSAWPCAPARTTRSSSPPSARSSRGARGGYSTPVTS